MKTLDLFAGPGGWDVAAREIGLDPLGVELDVATRQTRKAAGLRTLRGNVADLDPVDLAPVDLLIASPPCQAWSMAGSRGGEKDKGLVYELTDHILNDEPYGEQTWEDERSALVTEPLRWTLALRPRFVALEQVPPVLDYWRYLATILRAEGYGVWTGILEAERYGVPQTRERAILMAELGGTPHPPAPTHQRYVPGEPAQAQPEDLFGGGLRPWVSMAEALGWGMTERPYPVVACSSDTGGPDMEKVGGSGAREQLYREQREGRWLNTGRDWKPGGTREDAQTIAATEPAPAIDSQANKMQWTHRPATTIAGDPRVFPPGGHLANDGRDNSRMVGRSENAIRVSEEEAAVLQGFPRDYPWQGNKSERFRQIGNAIPPPLARAILTALVGAKVPA